ncbi:Ulp1-like peptidase [Cucumis melo var. makuwa]|uniref:Ulp1-like peptidase n=1 Tax=Cucumis melo var. makuwa TaxID=1194695 RepID=A0A5D3BAV2_CUCMM|nr:Ulp1-like peptidase [Cucumis melo var. makuwa]
MFDKTIFGQLLNVNMVFNGRLIHHFLLRQIPKDGNTDGICFSVLGKNVHFTQKEFNIITFKDKSTREKKAYELKKTTSSKAVAYYNIKGYVLAFQVWAYEVLSTASEHLATKNSKGLIPRILRWNYTQAPSNKILQKNIFDNKNTVVKPKLKLSTQEKAFMESRIRGDDNIQMEDDESIRDTPDHAINNKSLEQSDSSPQLSPQREQSQTVADQSEMHPITNKKRCRSKKSNDKEQQSHSKSYKKLKKEIKEVRKDLSTLTSIARRMDDTIRKQSLELSEMKQMLERLVQNQNENQGNDHTHQNDNDDQNREDMITSEQAYVEEQHTEHEEETQREHQQEFGSDISIDGRDADLLMTIRDISDNLNTKSQKEKDLPVVITILPLETTKQHVEIHKNDEAVTLVEKEPVTVPDKDEEQKPIKRRKLWWEDVNFVIGCINIEEHWLVIAADMRKCKIYVFDSMPNYVEQKLVDQALQMPARYIASPAIAIGVNLYSE